jgi:hypothetical protein
LNSENVAATPNRTRRVENKEAETKPESKRTTAPKKRMTRRRRRAMKMLLMHRL